MTLSKTCTPTLRHIPHTSIQSFSPLCYYFTIRKPACFIKTKNYSSYSNYALAASFITVTLFILVTSATDSLCHRESAVECNSVHSLQHCTDMRYLHLTWVFSFHATFLLLLHHFSLYLLHNSYLTAIVALQIQIFTRKTYQDFREYDNMMLYCKLNYWP